MDVSFEDDDGWRPVSPSGQYFNSSVMSVSVLAILELEHLADDSLAIPLLQNVFLPINPRFSSVMVKDDQKGLKQWKRVEVNLKDHITVPVFPAGMSPESYDDCFNEYLSKVAMDEFPQSRPLWQIHIFKYPTSNASSAVIFKLHHALGDGFSLMGALLSCLQRADDPSIPLTFPSFKISTNSKSNKAASIFMAVPRFLSATYGAVMDFGWSFLKSTFVQDDQTPIRSGDPGVEFRPIDIITATFPLEHIKQVKTKLGVTINDVVTGMIFFGTRLFMEESSQGSGHITNANSTALVLLNTRTINGYKSVKEMVEPEIDTSWGNQFAFLHIAIPKLGDEKSRNPLDFVWEAQKIIMKKRSSSGVLLTGRLLEAVRKLRGPEATARYIYNTLKNTSMTVSNLIGPVERMALADHPIKGLYFMVVGVPQSLTVTILSYMGNLRVAVGMERGLIHPKKFKSCIEEAFAMIFQAASETASHK